MGNRKKNPTILLRNVLCLWEIIIDFNFYRVCSLGIQASSARVSILELFKELWYSQTLKQPPLFQNVQILRNSRSFLRFLPANPVQH